MISQPVPVSSSLYLIFLCLPIFFNPMRKATHSSVWYRISVHSRDNHHRGINKFVSFPFMEFEEFVDVETFNCSTENTCCTLARVIILCFLLKKNNIMCRGRSKRKASSSYGIMKYDLMLRAFNPIVPFAHCANRPTPNLIISLFSFHCNFFYTNGIWFWRPYVR